jgi:hypothetical protein
MVVNPPAVVGHTEHVYRHGAVVVDPEQADAA